MNADIAIHVDRLSKRYRLVSNQRTSATLRDQIATAARSLGRGRRRTSRDYIWALSDVSFDVPKGKAFGIIGPNGAGKSTLLRILSQITDPTDGYAEISGTVSSLLEVGTGFHLELTGRENVYFSGALLGMRRREIASKFDEIVAFAELSRFIDMPVKRYSSGMLVRLGFAVAAHLETEIMLVDEVLAVGDAAFQRKCLAKTADVAGEGRTVCIVSHQLGLITALCDQALLLEDGKVAAHGGPSDVVQYYIRSLEDSSAGGRASYETDLAKPAQLRQVSVSGPEGSSTSFDVFDVIQLEVVYDIREPLDGVVLHVLIRRNGDPLFLTYDTDTLPDLLHLREPGSYRAVVTLPSPLKAGLYSVELSLFRLNVEEIDTRLRALDFVVDELSIDPSRHSAAVNRPGVIATALAWSTTKLNEQEGQEILWTTERKPNEDH
jgi:lipopolysaccharide transport system ATP-binding protein